MANLYVSGSLKDITFVRVVQDTLRREGHTISYDWTRDEITPSREEAERQIAGVYDADLLVLLDHPRGKGKYIEVGHALAHDIPVLVVPHAEATGSMFYDLPLVTVSGAGDFIADSVAEVLRG